MAKDAKTTFLVILSGGQDSATCLLSVDRVAVKQVRESGFEAQVQAVSFDYGQRHIRELQCAVKIAADQKIKHDVIALSALRGTSPLVSDAKLGQYEKPEQLPGGTEPTFVPCRNIVFLSYAANYALYIHEQEYGAFRPLIDSIILVTGVSEADYGGYPDCRESFIVSMEEALNEGLFGTMPIGHTHRVPMVIHTPLIHRTKKETVELAKELGGLSLMALTHTCYTGEAQPCRKCHACIIRERGFLDAGEVDPLVETWGLPWPPEWHDMPDRIDMIREDQ